MWKARTDATLTLGEAAKIIGGTLHGDASRLVRGLCPLDTAAPDCITFSRNTHLHSLQKHLGNCKIAAILLPTEPTDWEAPTAWNFIVLKEPQRGMLALIDVFFERIVASPGIHPTAFIDPSAKLGKSISIGAHCSVGAHVQIGDGAVLHPNVTLYQGSIIGAGTELHSQVSVREYCEIGDRCILHNGVVIGADGFGYVPDATRGLAKVPQVGIVRIGNDVEIGANSCVDRAALGVTEIGAGTKLDNLVQIGHNVRIQRSSLLCAQVGVGGSATIGNGVIIGGQTGVGDHTSIGDRVRVAARSGVSEHLKQGDYGGYPAVDAREWRKQTVALRRLPELLRSYRRGERNDDGAKDE